jgi:hypothetical protein
MTSIRSATHAASRSTAHTVPAPTLRKGALPSALGTAAKDLLNRSSGNDVSVATFKTSPAQLAALSKDVGAFKAFLYKTGMGISKNVPTPDRYAKHSVKPFEGKHFSQQIYDWAQVPTSVPETDVSKANEAAALNDAKTLATALHKTGGDVYAINWNNQDDTDVNILAAVNKKSGELTFVKLFPAI